MKVFSMDDENYIISQYITGIALSEISKKYNCHHNTCKKILIKHNIRIRNCRDVGNSKKLKLSMAEEQKIIELYKQGLGIKEIAKNTQHGTKNISDTLVKNKIKFKIPNKIHNFDEHIFDFIDTKEKAYWIGMLLSDGCIYKNKYAVCLALNKKDKEHLIKFRKFLNASNDILNAGQNVLRITIHSKYLVKTIKQYGLIPNKTFNEHMPNIPNDFKKDFWRGMIDGDGWIFRSNQRREWYIGLCGSYEIIEQFSKYIGDIFNIPYKKPSKANSIFKIQYSGTHLPKKIIGHFYSNSEIYLDRKMNKAQEIIKEIQ